MGNTKKFILNGLLLTATSLLLRWIGVIYNSFLSNTIGSEGMGVYSLVMSVFGFATTFACSGINLGTTRLVSESLAYKSGNDVRRSVLICTSYSLFFSSIASIILFFGADYIGDNILGDKRTIEAIRILALSLPFISASSVFNGYFSAVRRVYKNATALIIETTIQIFITSQLLIHFGDKGVEFACSSVALGVVLSEFSSLLFNLIALWFDLNKHIKKLGPRFSGLRKKLLGISMPLAFSTYIRSGLVTVEHLLIPYGLRKYGSSHSASLSTYGIIQGMVFPVIMFPSCLVYSFSGLIVPELSALNKQGRKNRINHVITKVIRYALVYSIGVAGIIMCFSYELSIVFYKSTEPYPYIKLLAPLIAVMYLDGAVDGVLKGLNEQVSSMKINIIDATLSVFLVWCLIPKLGLSGYIITLFVCEIVNCGLSLTRLVKISSPSVSPIRNIIQPLANIITATTLVTYLFDFLNVTEFTSYTSLAVRVLCTALVYILLFHIENVTLNKSRVPKKTFL